MYILLTVAYDGTAYCGWQRQRNGISVQQKTEEALEAVYGLPIAVTGASRTDAGVHAVGQKAGFCIEETKIPLSKLPQVINMALPQDIRVQCAVERAESFHPRFDAKEKTYEYKIQNAHHPLPQLRNFSYFVPYTLDFQKMEAAAGFFVGTHDFKAFCATGGSAKTTIRTIYHASLTKSENNIISFVLKGNGFLYNMVRIMAGTLVYVGSGKIEPSHVPMIIRSGDRARAGITAPPQGLTLLDIRYG